MDWPIRLFDLNRRELRVWRICLMVSACLGDDMDAALAVAGTLLGVILGTVGARLNYMSAFRREAGERLAASRRETYVEWLTELNGVYRAIWEPSSSFHRDRITGEELWHALHDVSPVAAQASLENVRLIATNPVAGVAAQLWAHARREAVPRGRDQSLEGWKSWQETYWTLRRDFLDAARMDIGFEPLDWATAGVHNR